MTTVFTESNTANPARTDLNQDAQTMPPFARVDELDKEIQSLDEWISTFIGRLQPYRVEPEDGVLEETVGARAERLSPFEDRIDRACYKLRAIRSALDTMNQGLRL